MLKLACVFWSVKEWLRFLRELAYRARKRELEIDPRDPPKEKDLSFIEFSWRLLIKRDKSRNLYRILGLDVLIS